ncbi:hypothetical protein C0081_06050 [Cohaesibacter celericrescens]|uniref:Serine protease n=1 Tax=Cohaesibacter celericrescens TaxID=2067669 RepID=A0A2N5XUK7_9HYPH|nr:hypothetical protein C0081_06050 [Cohaesibacter celericrescens]
MVRGAETVSGQQSFLKSVRYKGEQEIRFRTRPILDTYEDGLDYLASHLPRYSRMFSEPAVKRDGAGELSTIAWYSDEAGQIQAWGSLDQTNKVRVAAVLRAFLSDLLDCVRRTNDEQAKMLVCWLNILSFDDDLIVVNGHPIFTNWGIVPAGGADYTDKLAHHLLHGLGQFLPEDYDASQLAMMMIGDPVSSQKEAGQRPDNGQEQPPADALDPVAQKPADIDSLNSDVSKLAFGHAGDQTRAGRTGPPHGAAPDGLETKESDRRSACWLPVLIACIVALLLLLLMLVPGFLVYPGTSGASALLTDGAIRQSEQALLTRIGDLKSQLSQRTCVAPPVAAAPPLSEQLSPQSKDKPKEALPSATAVVDVVPLLEAATVLVVASDSKANMSSGSGFFVSPDKIVTNRHVVEPAKNGQVLVVNKALGGARRGKVIATSSSKEFGEQDYALIQMLGEPAKRFLPVALKSDKGQQIYAAGFPAIFMETDEHFIKLFAGVVTAAPDMVLTQGIVTVFQDSPSGNKLVLHSADISPGNSGGPLADTCGRVVGVNTFIKTSTEQQMRLNFALKSDSLLSFLKANGVTLQPEDTSCSPQMPRAQAGK